MKRIVSSRFSVSSAKFDSAFLKKIFPWQVVESSTRASCKKVGFHVAVFDLGVGTHERVDQHLVAAKAALLKQEPELDSLFGDCQYGLWVEYCFPPNDGAINISHSVSAAWGLLHVELIFHLKPRSKN